MADYQSPRAEKSSSSEMKRKKKRKLPHSENKHEDKASKLSRIDQSDVLVNQPIEEDKETTTELLEDASPWRNLQLILSLQKKNLNIEEKVELAYKYVKLSSSQVAGDTTQPSEAVSFDRVISFLNNWVQSTLISSEKEIRVSGLTPQFGVSGSCLDYRCWKIFKFCLENGMKLHVSLSFSKDILKVIHCITKNMEIKHLNDDELTLYNTMLDCISLIFTSHGGVSNENLDLWILLVGTVLELALKVITDKLNSSKSGTLVLNLTCVLLEPFIKFLRLHPNKKNGFQDFVDKLLEPLLCLLHLLHSSDLSSCWMSKLLKLIEEVLSQGLFHPSHLDGFLSLQSLSKYKPSDDGKLKDSKTVIRSYHRHLFDKLGRIVKEKKALALFGEGELFRLYVQCIKRQDGLSALTGEIRKSLFDFFVQIMEPLLGDVDVYLQDGVEVGSVLEDVHCTLKSFNSILISLMQEKVYARVDDTSEGACANFLKLICDKVTLLSAKIDGLVPSTFYVSSGKCNDFVGLVAKEVVSCLHYLLEIDYEVLGNDLESLWLLMFSYGTLGHNLTNLSEKSTIIPEILHLGCHMVNLYSELRQVGTSVFALCKAIRSSRSRGIEANHSESWAKSVRLILCSPELRLSIHNAVKSIPEGQVGLSIKELAADVSESLEWMKGTLDNSHHDVQLKAEVLGGGLSEVYALILDSLMVTTGNSSLVGVSLNALVTVISPSMSILISQPKEGVYEFLSMVSRRKFSNQAGSHWIFLFFFRLYMSSRSLYRQAISLAPPTTSKKMSEVMRDSFTAYSGNDWLEKTEKDQGYFSWIVQPSVSLLLIIEAISDVCTKESMADLSPLTYVLNAMALQRLIDLNRLVKSFEFVVKRNDMIIEAAKDEEGIYGKQNKRLGKRLLKLTEEASGLASYIMGHLSLLNKCHLDYEDGWDFAVAAIDEKSLPSAYWCLICQNIDIWSTHAAKKKLKKFLLTLLQHSLPYVSSNFKQFGEQNGVGDGNLKTVTVQEISLELLSNTMLYEEKFVRKHLASRFCCFLQELVSPLLSTGVDIELQAETNWPEVLSSLKIPSVVSNNINETNDGSSRNLSSSLSMKKRCTKQEADQSSQMYTACQSSLDFLCWMPKRWINSKSFSLYATCILNLERLIVGALLGDRLHDHYELLKLLLCCRKALKHLMVTFCEENMESSHSLTALHLKGKFPALWLLKSLLSVQHTFSKDDNTQVTNLIFSLTDYTSYVFLTLIKGTLIHANHSLISSRDILSASDQEDSIDATNFMIHVTEFLKDHAEAILTPQACYGRATSVLACFQGFLWGLSSALSYMDARNVNIKAVFSRRNFAPVDQLRLITKCLCEVVLEDSSREASSDGYEKRLNLEILATGSTNVRTSLLQSLVEGENVQVCLFLRRLFISYSAILRLNSQIKAPLSSKLVAIFIQVSEILLSGFSKNAGTPSGFTSVLLDGIGKFLEELGNHLSSSNPTLPPEVYERLIDLHLKAIGKCISLQGKRAALESHETESSTKTMNGPFSGSSCLDELKSRLRVSFKVFVGKPSEVYISSAVQSIKRALVGRQEGGMTDYQICTGSSEGGNVSSVVAAGIDCLDLVLEAITGRKSLNTVKTDILGSVCCLFNIILHLEGPQIFYRGPTSDTDYSADPDPGSVILMCIEVVTKVSGKHALYQMDACYVAQALSIPSTLFQNMFQAPTPSAFPNEGMKTEVLDRQCSIELYAACCRMLHTLLRHHKRESLQHIALLEASVSVLLHCLEMVNSDQKGNFVWGLEEGVKCGAFLRRIYEEIRQQKDVIGENCRLFLSSYIVVYSGYGPLKAGIRREIDEALRPGVYALIDACSPDDLQYIHTLLGEGPCRNTLANLQHDYKLNFQYEGKV